jgi:hypothetical protein
LKFERLDWRSRRPGSHAKLGAKQQECVGLKYFFYAVTALSVVWFVYFAFNYGWREAITPGIIAVGCVLLAGGSSAGKPK